VEEAAPGEPRPVGRVGKPKSHPFSRRYDRFGQIDTFSRYAFVACGHALDEAGVAPGTPEAEATGVSLGTAFGCMEANLLFDQFTADPLDGLRGASPLHFKGTLHNAPAGWCAVGWQLRGPNATSVSGRAAGSEAIALAERTVREGRAPRMVTGGVDRLIDLQLLLADPPPPGVPGLSEGAATLLIEAADAAHARGATPLLGVVGTARGTGRGGLLPLLDLLRRADQSVGDLAGVFPGPLGQEDEDRLLSELREAGACSSLRVVHPERRLGDPLAAWPAVAVASLLADPEPFPRGALAAIHQRGETGESHWLLVAGA